MLFFSTYSLYLLVVGMTACHGRPTLTSFPEELTASDGDNVTLTCIVEGFDATRNVVFWKHNSDVISMGREILQPSRQLTVDGEDETGTFNLHIQSVTVADEGRYMCQVPGYQPVVEQISSLTVNVRPTFAEFSPDVPVLDAEVGDKLQLHCTANGKPQPSISWTRRSADQSPDDDKEEFITDWETLIVASLSRHDGGVYICTAENSATAVKRQVHVNVQYKPSVERDMTSQHVDVSYGQDAQLICAFRSNPAPTVTWLRDDVTIDVTAPPGLAYEETTEKLNNTDIYQATLTINEIDTEDVGLYRCVAENRLGAAYSDIFVSGLPGHVGVEDDIVCEFCDECALQWTVESLSPVISYQLEYESEIAVPSSNETVWSVYFTTADGNTDYTLKGLDGNTTYRGRLKAINVFGSSAWSRDFSFRTADVGKTAPPAATTSTSTVVAPRLQRDHVYRPNNNNNGVGRFDTFSRALVVLSAVLLRLVL